MDDGDDSDSDSGPTDGDHASASESNETPSLLNRFAQMTPRWHQVHFQTGSQYSRTLSVCGIVESQNLIALLSLSSPKKGYCCKIGSRFQMNPLQYPELLIPATSRNERSRNSVG